MRPLSPLSADNNECAAQSSACGSRASCVNTPGSFNCECTKGFSLDSTGIECEGVRSFHWRRDPRMVFLTVVFGGAIPPAAVITQVGK